jgi:hypothetical protein
MEQLKAEERQNYFIAAGTAINDNELYNLKSIRFALMVSFCYLLLSYMLIGFRIDQLVLVGIFNASYFGSRATRSFILGFSIFAIYWIIFDYMKAFPNFQYNDVNIESLYYAEKSVFGIEHNNALVTPNEFLNLHRNSFLDILSGAFYLCWVPVPLIFAGVGFFKNRSIFYEFSLTFLLVNIIGFIGYYIYPAAPPWYIAEHGFHFNPATPGFTAGLARFDHLTGLNVFHGLYAKSSNVFAAMPSLHASYMLIVVFYGVKMGLKYWNILFALLAVGIWFAAVYSQHHYVLDILAGISCAFLGFGLFQYLISTPYGRRMMERLIV